MANMWEKVISILNYLSSICTFQSKTMKKKTEKAFSLHFEQNQGTQFSFGNPVCGEKKTSARLNPVIDAHSWSSKLKYALTRSHTQGR